MESGLPRNTFIERRIDDLYTIGLLTIWYSVSLWVYIESFFEKLTLKNLKNKVTFNYYRLLNKIKKDSNESKNNTH